MGSVRPKPGVREGELWGHRLLGDGSGRGRLFGTLLGVLLAVSLVKLGNPVILQHLVAWPENLAEWLWVPWPLVLGYLLWGVVMAWAWPLARLGVPSGLPRFLIWCPLAWLGWQVVAMAGSVDRGLSGWLVLHYTSVTGCYFAGLLALSRVEDLRGFWVGLTAGLVWVLVVGVDQYYGGLAATRRWVYEQPGWETLPPEYLARLAGERVFSTLFYANTLAGVILLLLPAVTVVCWGFWPERLRLYRAIATGLLVYAGLGCLYWSGSRAGWLIAAVIAFIGLLGWSGVGRGIRLTVALLVLGVMLGVFGVRFADYFERGATSAVARLDYWRVAAQIVSDNVVLGSGPGTFGDLYREMKPPEAEMSRVVHNDYLQQASDSGLPGALFFGGWMVVALWHGYGRSRSSLLARSVWLGILGWSLQGWVEFGLMIPAVSWVGMVLLGWLLGAEHGHRQASEERLACENQ